MLAEDTSLFTVPYLHTTFLDLPETRTSVNRPLLAASTDTVLPTGSSISFVPVALNT